MVMIQREVPQTPQGQIIMVKQLRTDPPVPHPLHWLYHSTWFCVYTVFFSVSLLVSNPSLLLSWSLSPPLTLLLQQVPSCAVETIKFSLCFSLPVSVQQRKQQKSNKNSQERKSRAVTRSGTDKEVLRNSLFTRSSSGPHTSFAGLSAWLSRSWALLLSQCIYFLLSYLCSF